MPTPAAASTATPNTGVINYNDMGYVLTTDPDDTLPDMDGFDRVFCGSPENGWTSPCEIRAGRDLAVGETLTAWLIRQSDGKILDQVSFTASEENCHQSKWPKAFAHAFYWGNRQMKVGNFDRSNEFRDDGSALPFRLWHFSCRNRAFTNAPFCTNQVQALAMTGDDLAEGTRLCVQVRDINTQALYENHFFTVKEGRSTFRQWGEDLCVALNKGSQLLRAGAKSSRADSTVTPSSTGNALWIPQDSDLCVTLTLSDWVRLGIVDGTQTLSPDQTIEAHVVDAFSPRDIVPALTFNANTSPRVQNGSWLSDWACQLKNSALAPFMRLGDSAMPGSDVIPANAQTATLWGTGDALRVFTTEPSMDNWVSTAVPIAALFKTHQTELVITVRRPDSSELLYAARFTPAQDGSAPQNKAQWVMAFCAFVDAQHWPYVSVGKKDPHSGHLACTEAVASEVTLMVPRGSDFMVELETVSWTEALSTKADRPVFLIDDLTGKVIQAYRGREDAVNDNKKLVSLDSGYPDIVPGGEVHYLCALPSFSLTTGLPDENKNEWVFRLSAEAKELNIKIVDCPDWGCNVTSESAVWSIDPGKKPGLIFHFPESVPPEKTIVVGHISRLCGSEFWRLPQAVECISPPLLERYVASSPLCEDYGNTFRSEVFDVSGQSETGVDAQTGLFHAHYPVATLQGLEGNGPVCDLTLHYSALRGNEAALGDGWAFRFSSLEIRDRTLTLANGTSIAFTDVDWARLGQGQCLKKAACWVTSKEGYGEFILDYPSGNREYLNIPQGDGSEPDEALRQKIIQLLQQIKDKTKPPPPAPSGWDWLLLAACPELFASATHRDWNEAVSKWRENVKVIDEAIEYWSRPFTQMLPTKIVSPDAGELNLTWNRLLGQFRLVGVNSGDAKLFAATYTHEKGMMDVWPGTTAAYQVELRLKDYLLESIHRYEPDLPNQAVQEVKCRYSADPTLDRILTCLEEEDGSLEIVAYQAESMHFPNGQPALPRVTRHTLIPGGRQRNITSYHVYSDNNYLSNFGNQFDSYENDLSNFYDKFSHVGNLLRDLGFLDSELSRLNLSRFQSDQVRGKRTSQLFMNMFYWVGSSKNDGRSKILTVFDSSHHSIGEVSLNDDQWVITYSAYQGLGDDGATPENPNLPKAILTLWNSDEWSLLKQAVELYRSGDIPGFAFMATCLLERFSLFGQTIARPNICDLIDPRYNSKDMDCEDPDSPFLLGAQELQAYMVSTCITTSQYFKYNKNDQLEKSVAADGTITVYFYYPVAGSAFSSSRLKGIVGGIDLPDLSCPKVPDYTSPPLFAEFQYQAFGSRMHPLQLTLYGYREKRGGARTSLVASDIVKLEGVIFYLDSWTFALADKQKAALIRHERVTEKARAPKTPNDGCKVFVWSASTEQTTYYKGDSVKLITTLSWEDNPQVKGFLLRTEMQTEKGTETVSTEIRSRYTRRCVVRRQGREEVRWSYDLMGRTTSEERFAIATGANRASDDAVPSSVERSAYTAGPLGVMTTTTLATGQVIRTLSDGLKREVRRELQVLSASDSRWCVLDEVEFSGDETTLNHAKYDYYPGGLRRTQETGERQALIIEPTAWTQTAFLKSDPGKSNTEQVVGVGAREVLTHTLQEEILSDGSVTNIQNYSSMDGLKRPEMTRQYDPAGNLVRLHRGGDDRSLRLDYDDIGRVTYVYTADGSSIHREYFGLSNEVSRLRVDGIEIAAQHITSPSVIGDRTVGARKYSYGNRTMTTPSGQVFGTDTSDDGRDTSLTLDGKRLSTLSFNDDKRNASVMTHEVQSKEGSFLLGPLGNTISRPEFCGNIRYGVSTPRGVRTGWETCSLFGRKLSGRRLDGSVWRVFSDRKDRPLRTRHNGVEMLYSYNSRGLTQAQSTVAPENHSRFTAEYIYDGFGQEIIRRYQANGRHLLQIDQSWSDSGLLVGSRLSRDGEVVRSEAFAHDSCDRLASYRCEAQTEKDYPVDSLGRRVKEQLFQWDGLQRLLSCKTLFIDVPAERQTYSYDENNPTRCVAIETDSGLNSKHSLKWNADGFLTEDSNGNTFGYSPNGQLLHVKNAQGQSVARYIYDGHGRLAAQHDVIAERTYELCYDGDTLCGEIWFDRDGKVIRQTSLNTEQSQQILEPGKCPQVGFLLDSPHSGTLSVWGGSAETSQPVSCFTPFGENNNALSDSLSGYNNQRKDPVTGCYHLGNGARTYNPILRRFQQPDNLSPFGKGGINDYSYCCNPVDYSDPSGHIMLSRWGKDRLISQLEQSLREARPQPVGRRWRGVALNAVFAVTGVILSIPTGGASFAFFAAMTVLSTLSLALEIAAVALENSNPKLAKALGIAALVVGGISSIGSLTKVGQYVAAAGRGLRWISTTAGKVAAGVQAGARGALRFFDNAKRFGFKHAYKLASKTTGRKVGDIAWLSPTEFVEYLGNGEFLTGTGKQAAFAWQHPDLRSMMKFTREVYSAVKPYMLQGFDTLKYPFKAQNAYESNRDMLSNYIGDWIGASNALEDPKLAVPASGWTSRWHMKEEGIGSVGRMAV